MNNDTLQKAASGIATTKLSIESADDPVEAKRLSSTLENIPSTLYLHVKFKYQCYYFYAEYYFETWVTTGESGDSERYPVESLTLRWRHGGTRGEEGGVNTAMVAKTDKTYNSGCDNDLCCIGIATINGITWGSSAPQGCSYA